MAEQSKPVESTTEYAKALLRRLLFKANDPIVVALYAGWGHGKTFFWKEEFNKEINGITPGYVSVFGASSLTEIRERVVISAAMSRVALGDRESIHKSVADQFDKYKFMVARIFDSALGKYGVPEGMLAQLVERSAVSRGWVLCLDDVERLSEKVPLDSLLGYIDQLKNECGIKIILLFNQEGFGQQNDIFKLYQEKVIDRQIPFQSDVREQLQRVFSTILSQSDDPALLDELIRRCDVLGLKNIRLLVKTHLYYQEVVSELPGTLDREFANGILYSLLLFVWIQHPAPNQRLAHDWEYIRGFSSYSPDYMGEDEQEGGREEDRKLLLNYGYGYTDELDTLLIDYIETDVLNSKELMTLYSRHNEISEKNALQKVYDSVWATQYQGSFKDNEAEFCDNLIAATRNYLSYIELYKFDGVLYMLSRLERDEEARSLLSQFADERQTSLANNDPYGRTRAIKYEPLDEGLKAAKVQAKADDRPVGEVLVSALGAEYPNKRDILRLAAFSVDDYYNHFVTAEQEHLLSQLVELARLGEHVTNADSELTDIRSAVNAAAIRLGALSRLNGIRLELAGITNPEPNAASAENTTD